MIGIIKRQFVRPNKNIRILYSIDHIETRMFPKALPGRIFQVEDNLHKTRMFPTALPGRIFQVEINNSIGSKGKYHLL